MAVAQAAVRMQADLDDAGMQSVMQEVRQVSHDLASGVLIKFGLVSALRELAEGIQSAGNMGVNFYDAGFDERIDSRTEIALYRISQELITNVLKHAQARTIRVTATHDEQCISIAVEDDGVGFEVEKATKSGRGLSNLRQRAALLDAMLEFESRPGATRACLRLPISRPAPGRTDDTDVSAPS